MSYKDCNIMYEIEWLSWLHFHSYHTTNHMNTLILGNNMLIKVFLVVDILKLPTLLNKTIVSTSTTNDISTCSMSFV